MHRLHGKPYVALAAMAVLSFISMYVLMYAMVDRFENVHSNLNQVYMAGLMTAPMLIIELGLMRSMYTDKRVNLIVVAGSAALALGFFFLIREQAAIGDREFLSSMIPHHGAAILMCQKAPIDDAEIRGLCSRIIRNQQSEIDWMKAKLNSDGG